MTVEGLKDILRQKEGTEIEFKQSREHLPRNVYESVCAFLNRRGGHVVLGVDDDGKVVGISQTHIQEQLDTLSKDMNNPYVPLISSGRKPVVEEQDEFRMFLPFNPLTEQESDPVSDQVEAKSDSANSKSDPVSDQVGKESDPADPKSDPVSDQVEEKSDPVSKLLYVLVQCLGNQELSISELMSELNLTHRPSFRKNYLHPALELGIIEYTLPNELRSPNQKYRLTPKGRLLLNKRKQK